jgi:hypothetical protein
VREINPDLTNVTFHAVFDALATLFSGGGCPKPGCIGEVAAGNFLCHGHSGERNVYILSAYVWNDSFNDHALVEKVAREAGADDVTIAHVLHDPENLTVNGMTEDGARAWDIIIGIKPATADGGKK